MSEKRKCSLCKREKLFTEKNFYRRRNGNLRKDCKACHKKRKVRHHLKTSYGITPEQKNQMLEQQQNRCLICEKDISGKAKSHIDHCHNTGKIRGILCSNCNRAIGLLSDCTKNLNRAIIYLQTSLLEGTILEKGNSNDN